MKNISTTVNQPLGPIRPIGPLGPIVHSSISYHYARKFAQPQKTLARHSTPRRSDRRQTGHLSGLCLALAIVLEAIQQQFDKFPTPPDEPEEQPESWKQD